MSRYSPGFYSTFDFPRDRCFTRAHQLPAAGPGFPGCPLLPVLSSPSSSAAVPACPVPIRLLQPGPPVQRRALCRQQLRAQQRPLPGSPRGGWGVPGAKEAQVKPLGEAEGTGGAVCGVWGQGLGVPLQRTDLRGLQRWARTQGLGATFHSRDWGKQIWLGFELAFLQWLLIYLMNPLSNTLTPDSHFYNILWRNIFTVCI